MLFCRENAPVHHCVWLGTCPFYKLNDTKLMYCRNRYLVPDILTKAHEEQTPGNVFNAKNSFSHAKSARDLSIDHGCRTEDCEACKRLQNSMKVKTKQLKTSYKDVKAGNVHKENGDTKAVQRISRCKHGAHKGWGTDCSSRWATPAVKFENDCSFDVNAEDVVEPVLSPRGTKELLLNC